MMDDAEFLVKFPCFAFAKDYEELPTGAVVIDGPIRVFTVSTGSEQESQIPLFTDVHLAYDFYEQCKAELDGYTRLRFERTKQLRWFLRRVATVYCHVIADPNPKTQMAFCAINPGHASTT
jgi:hypothetical protein